MRILQVIEFFSPSMGGSAQVAYQVARHLAARGHEVTVAASDFSADGSRFPDDAFQVRLFPSVFSRWGFYVTPGLVRWAQEHLASCDIVHLHNVRTFQNAVIAALARRRGLSYVMSAHGSLPVLAERRAAKRSYDLMVGRRLVHGAAQLIAVSPVEAQQFQETGIAPERISLVYNGLDPAEYAQLPARGQFRRRWTIPVNARVVLSLGRIHRIKGIDHLIAAFARLRVVVDNAVLIVAGPDDGDLARLREVVDRAGLVQSVRFPGGLYGAQKLAALIDADVVAAPSQYEIFGIVPFEALMCGTPVVVTAGSASGQLLSQAGAAYLAPYGDADALSQALLAALAHPVHSRQMVQAGQAFVRQRLQWPAIAHRLEQVYTAALSAQASAMQPEAAPS